MSDQQETIGLDLDPKKVLASIETLNAEFKNLADNVNDALGKKAPKAIKDLEDAADKGTGRISEYFRNLGQRVREDLKTAFDATGVLAGAKFAKDLGAGVAQVFEMERAFDRLNTRLRLSNKEMQEFKNNIGRKVAGTGQKLEDVLPGVETAAAKGGVKDAGQLSDIGEALGKVKAATGEDADHLSDTVVQILKDQGKSVTATSFKSTLDALQGTRVAGAFHSAAEAGGAVQGLTKGLTPEQQAKMGLGSRNIGGLAASASAAGPGGIETLNKLLIDAAKPGGTTKLNAILGQEVFKNGKLDAGAFGKVDKNKYGKNSAAIFGDALGADPAELSRLMDALKGGMDRVKTVTDGANETTTQFEQASDNLASGVDRFKEHVKEAGREVGEQLSALGKDLLQGNFGSAWEHTKGAIASAHENKGTLLAAGAITAGVGLLAGGSLSRLLKKGGGLAGGLAKGEGMKAAGVEPVYVVNAGEIGESVEDQMTGLMENTKRGSLGLAGKAAGLAKGVIGAAAAAEIGLAIGDALMQIPAFKNATGAATDWAYDKLNGKSDAEGVANAEKTQLQSSANNYNQRHGTNMTVEQFAEAVEKGTLRANQSKARVNYTNPSTVTGRR